MTTASEAATDSLSLRIRSCAVDPDYIRRLRQSGLVASRKQGDSEEVEALVSKWRHARGCAPARKMMKPQKKS